MRKRTGEPGGGGDALPQTGSLGDQGTHPKIVFERILMAHPGRRGARTLACRVATRGDIGQVSRSRPAQAGTSVPASVSTARGGFGLQRYRAQLRKGRSGDLPHCERLCPEARQRDLHALSARPRRLRGEIGRLMLISTIP